MSARLRLQVVLLLVGAAACQCQDAFAPVEATSLTIDSPADGASSADGLSFDYHATATSSLGVTSLALEAGGSNGVALQVLTTCLAVVPDGGVDDTPDGGMDGGVTVPPAQTKLTCDLNFVVDSHRDLVADGTLTLTAVALNSRQQATTKTITVQIEPLTCLFTAPTVTAGTSPAEALVAGTSPLTISTTAIAPLSSVAVTADSDAATVAVWTGTGPYTQEESWIAALGLGTHNLVATCTYASGDVASSQLTVQVRICLTDSNCSNGERCCSNDGTCNPVVGEGADCGCDLPCPTSEGCFSGICGETPAKCYPGCNPGTTTGSGTLPQACPDQAVPDAGMQQAFCNPLPTDQVTTQNLGGACVPGDGCNVVTQNCPELPLDRSQPEGPGNPLVKYNCLPVAPNLTGCYPAGTLTSGQANCNQQCGSVAAGTAGIQANCAQGYECVTPVDQNGNPLGLPTCEQQCDDPTNTDRISDGCPGNDEVCTEVYEPFGQQMDYFTTGSCCAPPYTPCTTNTECCDGTCSRGYCE